MAKGQKRSTKEAKKPKQVKTKAPEASSLTARLSTPSRPRQGPQGVTSALVRTCSAATGAPS